MKKSLIIILLTAFCSLGVSAFARDIKPPKEPSNCFSQGTQPVYGYGKTCYLRRHSMVGGGCRFHQGKSAFDISADVKPCCPKVFHMRGLYLHYPRKSGSYYGAGMGLVSDPTAFSGVRPSLETAVGYQWQLGAKSSMFMEFNFIAPIGTRRHMELWPALSVGFRF